MISKKSVVKSSVSGFTSDLTLGDTMKDNHTQTTDKKKDIIETSVYCMNTKRKYIYELQGGQIISERVVQCTE